MRTTIFLITTLITAFFFGCGESSDPNEKLRKEKFDEVIAVHDVVMPLWGNMPTLRKELGKYQTLIKADPSSYSPEDPSQSEALVDEIEEIREDLRKGHEGMRNWMKNVGGFSSKPKSMSHEDYLNRLEIEKDKITEVKALMESSTEAAKAMIAKLKQ